MTTTLGINNDEDELVCVVRTPSLQHQGDQELLVVAAGESEPGAPVALWECTGAPITVAGPAEAPQVRDGYGEEQEDAEVVDADGGSASP